MLRVFGFQIGGAVIAIMVVAGLVDIDRFAYATGWLIWIGIALLGMIAGGQLGAAGRSEGREQWHSRVLRPRN